MGMVIARVNVAHGELFSALTTTKATTPKSMIMMEIEARKEAATLADLVARHFSERFSVSANGTEQDDEILHAAGKSRSGNQPERPRQISELRGQCWTDERPGPGDGREMMAEEHPFVGRDEIATVISALGGRGASVVQNEKFRRNESGVDPIGDQVKAGCRQDKPGGVDWLSTMEGDGRKSRGAERGNGHPDENAQKSFHACSSVRDALMECS